MRDKFNRSIVKLFQLLGYTISKSDPVMEDDVTFKNIYTSCEKQTMTSRVKMYDLYKSIAYVMNSNIPGDFVECGVWKGGSAMLIAHSLLALKKTDRNIYLYDTFEGMSEPTEEDRLLSDTSVRAKSLLEKRQIYKAISPLEEVKENMYSTGYPQERIHFIKGKVEQTIPDIMPDSIALLRLDTDWYESSLHELQHLYPKLSKHGVLILDDYGFWMGQKKAVDEYFVKRPILLSGTSDGGRMGVKLE